MAATVRAAGPRLSASANHRDDASTQTFGNKTRPQETHVGIRVSAVGIRDILPSVPRARLASLRKDNVFSRRLENPEDDWTKWWFPRDSNWQLNGKTKPRKCRHYSGPFSGKSRTETFRAKMRTFGQRRLCCIEVHPSDHVAMQQAKISSKSLILQTVWWARRDSNPQPSGYEPPALTIELQAPRRLH
jgi:hypothetical protein